MISLYFSFFLVQASITSITWGLDGSTLLIAQGDAIHSVTVNHNLPTLKFLCRRLITDKFLKDSSKEEVNSLPLPERELEALQALKTPLIPVSCNYVIEAVSDY